MRVGDLRQVLDGLPDTVELAVRKDHASFPRAVREVRLNPGKKYHRKGPMWVGSGKAGATLLVFMAEEGGSDG